MSEDTTDIEPGDDDIEYEEDPPDDVGVEEEDTTSAKLILSMEHQAERDRKTITKLRSESARYRVRNKELLGENKELTTYQEQKKLRDRFDKIADGENADRDLTWAVATSQGDLSLSDPPDDDGMKALVVRLVGKNPKLGAGPGVPDQSGRTIGNDQESISRLLTRDELLALSPEEIEKDWDRVHASQEALMQAPD